MFFQIAQDYITRPSISQNHRFQISDVVDFEISFLILHSQEWDVHYSIFNWYTVAYIYYFPEGHVCAHPCRRIPCRPTIVTDWLVTVNTHGKRCDLQHDYRGITNGNNVTTIQLAVTEIMRRHFIKVKKEIMNHETFIKAKKSRFLYLVSCAHVSRFTYPTYLDMKFPHAKLQTSQLLTF